MTSTEGQTLRFPGTWHIEYQYTVGAEAAAFFEGLRKRQVLGSRCDSCGQVAVPPKAFCERCFKRVSEMVPVGHVGTIAAATVVLTPFEGSPPVPYCVAYVTLDGASTATANYVRGVVVPDELTALPTELEPGQRVQVRFTDDPQGRLSDFWFAPIGVS
jgi:uncharacterized OB-fold protein